MRMYDIIMKKRNGGELSKDVVKPGKLSSLSMVPPVWPSPLPLIFATGMPQAATMGARARDVLSPTPPVLCLSTFTPLMPDRSSHHGALH